MSVILWIFRYVQLYGYAYRFCYIPLYIAKTVVLLLLFYYVYGNMLNHELEHQLPTHTELIHMLVYFLPRQSSSQRYTIRLTLSQRSFLFNLKTNSLSHHSSSRYCVPTLLQRVRLLALHSSLTLFIQLRLSVPHFWGIHLKYANAY